jgi:hypothetical protein
MLLLFLFRIYRAERERGKKRRRNTITQSDRKWSGIGPLPGLYLLKLICNYVFIVTNLNTLKKREKKK